MAAFTWGEGGSRMTPEQIAAQRKIAQAMMLRGGDYTPIQHYTQGMARVAESLMGGLDARSADQAERTNAASEAELIASLMPGAPAAAGPVAGTNPAMAAQPMGALPRASSRLYDQSEMNPLDAAVATPQELAVGVPAPKQYASMIGKAAIDNDLPAPLLAAQIKQESAFDPRVISGQRVSSAGAQGISQFMPATAREMGIDPLDPTQAIPAGARYLRQNIDKFGGSVPLGLAAYNAGPGRVERSGGDISRLPEETRGYVANITGAAGQPAATPVSTVAAAMPGVNPKIMSALASPYISDGTKRILMMYAQQQMKPPDFSYQTTPDGTILRMSPRGEAPVPVYQAPKNATWGVVDETDGKKTYGWIDPVKRTTEVAGGALAPQKQTVTGPDGKEIPIPPGVDRKKFVADVTSATADAATGKKTEVQAKSEKFGNKMELAEHNLKDLESQGQEFWGRVKEGSGWLPGSATAGNYMQSKEYQQYKQGRDNFITALLRDESGAAIGTPEFERYVKELFPLPGDGPEVIAQKREARKVAIEGMKKAAGPGYKSPALASKDGGDAPEGVDAKVWKHMTPEERKLWK